ncbi:hypothetical protein [Halopelagius longus]|uniref:DUF4386 family protein n=1 Tax=Halopelagius longus TaxID=1236180 RepID=A0A1H0ZC00_9EURY|nr:hypothetical protein [Halopelagius longus]RDI72922.1 hypothetical protein DWB78_14980 [Halopelagius longus]SDQ24711.1 hypothetical protein SAMN05216278_1123 [Halopelagius longus]
MTTELSDGPERGGSLSRTLGERGRQLILLLTPLALAASLWFHPAAGDDVYGNLGPVVDTWLAVHVLLLLLFGLLGVCLYVLLMDFRGVLPTVGRIGVAVYLVFYIAFESIAGVATGVLIREAHRLPAEQRAGIETVVGVIYGDPVNGLAGLFALVGTVGYLVAVVAIAAVRRRNGAPVLPLLLLVGSSVGLAAHGSSPWDSISILLFAVAAGWLEVAETPTRAAVSG